MSSSNKRRTLLLRSGRKHVFVTQLKSDRTSDEAEPVAWIKQDEKEEDLDYYTRVALIAAEKDKPMVYRW